MVFRPKSKYPLLTIASALMRRCINRDSYIRGHFILDLLFSYIYYEMTTDVKFCYTIWHYFLFLNVSFCRRSWRFNRNKLTFQQKHNIVTVDVMSLLASNRVLCNLCSKSFITWRYPLGNSDVIWLTAWRCIDVNVTYKSHYLTLTLLRNCINVMTSWNNA